MAFRVLYIYWKPGSSRWCYLVASTSSFPEAGFWIHSPLASGISQNESLQSDFFCVPFDKSWHLPEQGTMVPTRFSHHPQPELATILHVSFPASRFRLAHRAQTRQIWRAALRS